MVDIEVIKQANLIRELSSQAAADWLMSTYPVGAPDYGAAFNLLTRRSWKRRDQIRLAEHYLARLPFAAAKPYRVFLSFMAADVFVAQLRKFLPSDESKAELLRYHLEVVMREGARSDGDRALFTELLAELGSARRSDDLS
ncbi:hypothetical protein [Stenotrophomonas sp. PD6]|uniref:hypothetical protein n=1 Tax=Stenotrophomonas sp. PD6 TaxID=3368612 RepID=UPI003BA24610